MKPSRIVVVSIIVVVVLACVSARLAGVWPFASGGDGKKASIQQPVRVTAVEVKRRNVPLDVRLVGTVYPYQSVAVKSRLDSQVSAVLFHDGDLVKRGDILFRLDDRALKAQRDEISANLKRDEAQLVNARAEYERAAKLAERGYETTEKLDQDKATLDAQIATVDATRATLNNLNVQIDYTIIRSPITGRAGTIGITLGNNAKANDTSPLVTVNQVDPALVQCSVPQRYYDQIKAIMSGGGDIAVKAVRPESNAETDGKLEYIDNAIDASNGTFVARASFANADEKLWPGMFVNVNIGLGEIRDAVVVPATAVQGEQDKRFVFIVNAQTGKAEKRPVIIDRMLDDVAVVKSGVADGDRVITDGLLRVSDGAAVDAAP